MDDSMIRMEKTLSKDELELLKKLGVLAQANGMGAWLVGGLVRDIILGSGGEDLDIVIEGDGLDFARKAAKELGVEYLEHERFMTATLYFPDGKDLDIATARTEIYENPGSLPRVARALLKDDMRRRDITINAMALCLAPEKFGGLFDPFEGVADIAAKTIRILHDRSFIDDPTRIIRAVRYEARFGFTIEPHTVELLKGAVTGGALDSISGDRLREELFNGFDEHESGAVFSRLSGLGILDEIIPGIDAGGELPRYLNDAHHVSALVEKGKEWEPAVLGLLLLVRGIAPEQAARLADRLKLGAGGRRAISMAPDLPEISRVAGTSALSGLHSLLSEAPLEVKLAVLIMMEGESNRRMLVEYLRQGKEPRPELNGDDLMAMGFTRGPVLKRILDALLTEKLDGRVHSRNEEEEFVRENFRPPDGEAGA